MPDTGWHSRIPFPPPRPIALGDVIPLHEQFDNHDEFRSPATDELAGVSLALHLGNGDVIDIEFADAAQLHWRARAPTQWGSQGSEAYEAVAVRDGVHAITAGRPEESRSALVILDRLSARAMINHTEFRRVDGSIVEETTYVQAGIGAALAKPFERTLDLIGKRIAQRYSTTHIFEHIYLNPNTYAFQGLAGPEAGVVDVDAADYFELGDQLYLFSWHERSQPFNGAVVLDLVALRATGRLTGWDADLDRMLQIRTGSLCTILSSTVYE